MKKHLARSFTLIEILVVIAIIGILLGMLIPVLIGSKDEARRAMAQKEITSIEIGLREYFKQQTMWPSNLTESSATRISGDIVDALEFNNDANLTLTAFDQKDKSGAPVNPWGDEQLLSNPDEYYYYAKVDINFDGKIEQDLGSGPPSNTVMRQVIIWTEDPTKEIGSEKRIIGNW